MKCNVIIGFESCILAQIDHIATKNDVSRAALIRAAVAEYLGVPHNELEKPAPKEKHRAYAGGQYLGTFPTLEAKQEAIRNATRQTFYYVVRTVGGFLYFDVQDTPGDHETYIEVQVFKHHAARRRYWETMAENQSGNFKDVDTVWEKLREFYGEEATKAEKQGCIVSVVVA